jgi:hypothetical protein
VIARPAGVVVAVGVNGLPV